MANPLTFLSLLLAIIFVSGCSVLLHEDFESYQQGQAIETGPIDDAPICDVIRVEGDAVQFTVSTVNAIQGNLSLEFEPAFSSEISRIDFLPCHTPDTRNSIIFQWRGRFEGGASSDGLQARIEDSIDPMLFHSRLFFNIRRESIEIGSGGTVLHTITGDFRLPHTIIARIAPSSNQFHVGVFSETIPGGNNTVSGDLLVDANIADPGLMLRMQWSPDSAPPAVYRVDEVQISRRQ